MKLEIGSNNYKSIKPVVDTPRFFRNNQNTRYIMDSEDDRHFSIDPEDARNSENAVEDIKKITDDLSSGIDAMAKMFEFESLEEQFEELGEDKTIVPGAPEVDGEIQEKRKVKKWGVFSKADKSKQDEDFINETSDIPKDNPEPTSKTWLGRKSKKNLNSEVQEDTVEVMADEDSAHFIDIQDGTDEDIIDLGDIASSKIGLSKGGEDNV